MSKYTNKADKENQEKQLVRDYFDNQQNGFFVDVGANEPTSITSQTWHLEDKLSWAGVLIEPNPIYLEQCKNNRPLSKFFSCACVSTNALKTITLYIPLIEGKDKGSHASIEKNIDDFNYHSHREVQVPTRTLNSILEEVGATNIDLLSVDVEGAELEVIKGLDISKFKPRLILLEDKHLYLSKHRYLKNFGYALVKRTGFNFWYVPKGAKRPPQTVLEKFKIWKRMYLSIWLKKIKFSITHRTIEPLKRL